MTSISASLITQSLYTRIDTNADGSVTKDEFVSGCPGDVSESQASAFFASLDTDGSGDVSQTELSDGLAANTTGDAGCLGGSLSSDMLSTVLQMLQESDSSTATDTPPSAEDIFSAMDTNGDSVVSKDEFLAAKPEDVSDEDALALYDSIDTDGTGSITLEQFENSIQANGAPPPPPTGGGGGGSSDDDTTYNALDTNKDGVVDMQELMAAFGSDESGSTGASEDNLTARLLQQIEKAARAYSSSQASATAGLTSSLLIDA